MSKLVIVVSLSENGENPAIRDYIRENVSSGVVDTIKEVLEEYQNYKFITDFTVEVKEQNGD